MKDCYFNMRWDAVNVRRRSKQRQWKLSAIQHSVVGSSNESNRPESQGRLALQQSRKFSALVAATDQGSRSAPQAQMGQENSNYFPDVVSKNQQVTRGEASKKKRARPRDGSVDEKIDCDEARDTNRTKPKSLIRAWPASRVKPQAEEAPDKQRYRQVLVVDRLHACQLCKHAIKRCSGCGSNTISKYQRRGNNLLSKSTGESRVAPLPRAMVAL